MKHWIALALVVASNAGAQSLAWKDAVYAEVAYEGSTTLPLYFARNEASPGLLFSAAGVPGYVIAGEASPDWGVYTNVPYASKRSVRDGHELWHWTLRADDPFEGRLGQAVLDGAGDVLLTGSVGPYPGSFLLAKLDGATGAVTWRVDGAASTSGYALGVDADGNVLTAGVGPAGSIAVGKYSGATGAPLWSNALPDGSGEWDDLRLVVDRDGNAIVAGAHAEAGFGGVRVAKFRAADGARSWTHQIVSSDTWGSAGFLHVLANGDMLALGAGNLDYLSGADGSARWERRYDGATHFVDVVEDGQGRVFVAETVNASAPWSVAVVAQLDRDDGTESWQAQPFGNAVQSFAGNIAVGIDGAVLASASVFTSPLLAHLQAIAVDPSSGEVRWAAGFGSSDPEDDYRLYDIDQRGDGSVFVGVRSTDVGQAGETWTLVKLTGPFADDIFANAFDG